MKNMKYNPDLDAIMALMNRDGKVLWLCCESPVDIDKFVEKMHKEVVH